MAKRSCLQRFLLRVLSCLRPRGVFSFVTFMFPLFSVTTILPGSTLSLLSGDGLLLPLCVAS